MLAQMGERIRLARLRRRLSNAAVSGRAGISRTSLYKVEAGDAGVTLGTYLRVLAALGLEKDLEAVAADDRVGRKLQDLALEPQPTRAKRKRAGSTNSAVIDEVATSVGRRQEEAHKAGIAAADIDLTRAAFAAHTAHRQPR